MTTKSTDLVWLAPDEIIVDESILRARPMYDSTQEAQEIEELAKSIQRDLQLEPVVVRAVPVTVSQTPDGTPVDKYLSNKYHLVAGRRRVDAINYVNSQRSKGEIPMLVSCIVSPIAEVDAFRSAIQENLKRKNLSGIQLALVCGSIREENGWTGSKGTRKVAEFLQVSPATVTTHEKLLELPEEIQRQVHSGDLTVKAAMDLADVKVEKRQEVFSGAQEIQASEESVVDNTDEQDNRSSDEETDQPPQKKKKPVKSTHVRRAAREVEGALVKPKPRSRKEIVEFFEMNDGPVYGQPDGAVRSFITYFLKWEKGEGTDRTLTAKFDKMVEKADQGTVEQPKNVPTKRSHHKKKK